MNNKFDELTKAMAQSVTRRAALKKFGVGLAGMALACFGLANKARAATSQGYCEVMGDGSWVPFIYTGQCMDINGCVAGPSADCPSGTQAGGGKILFACGTPYKANKKCSF